MFPRVDKRWPASVPEPVRDDFDLEEFDIIQHIREFHHIAGGWNVAFGTGDADPVLATNSRLVWRKARRRQEAERLVAEQRKKRADMATQFLHEIAMMRLVSSADYDQRLSLEDAVYEILDWPDDLTAGQCRVIRGFNLFALQRDAINIPDRLILRGTRADVCRFVAPPDTVIRSSTWKKSEGNHV
jgi:hypothetical protein